MTLMVLTVPVCAADMPSDRFSTVPSDRISDMPSDGFSTVPHDRFSNMSSDGLSTVPRELFDTLPEGAEPFVQRGSYGTQGFSNGVNRILSSAAEGVFPVFRERLKSGAAVLLAVILCSAVRGLGANKGNDMAISLAGALSITALSAGSLEQLIGLGWKTIGQLSDFSASLLPVLAAATAAAGSVSMATFQQVTAVFLAQALLALIDGLLMPLTYLYIGVLTASCALPEDRLSMLAAGLKKFITGILTAALMMFTVYLSVFHVIAGSADSAAVRTARAAISKVVPVVGGIIADASEAMLSGAGLLRNSIGIFGMLTVLAACIQPFLHLGIQYLIYKMAAFFASSVGMPELCRLTDGLGGAFGLVLGMTAGCALLLLVSILSFVSAFTP